MEWRKHGCEYTRSICYLDANFLKSVTLALVEGANKIPVGIIAGNVTGGAFDWTIDNGLSNANDYFIQIVQNFVYTYSPGFEITGAKTPTATLTPAEQPNATHKPSNSSASDSAATSDASSGSSASSATSRPVAVPSPTAAGQDIGGSALLSAHGNSTSEFVGGHVKLTTGGIVGIVIGVIAIFIGISTIGIFALVLKMLAKHGPPPPPHDDVEELSSLGPAASMNRGPGGGPDMSGRGNMMRGGPGPAPTYYPKRTHSDGSDSSGVLGRTGGGLNSNPLRPYDEMGSPETLVPRRMGSEDITLVSSAAGSGRVSPNDRYAAAGVSSHPAHGPHHGPPPHMPGSNHHNPHPGQQVPIGGDRQSQDHNENTSPTSIYPPTVNGGIIASGFAPGEYRYGGGDGGYNGNGGSLIPPPLHSQVSGDSQRTMYGEQGRNLTGGMR
jgi:hypothetical protein